MTAADGIQRGLSSVGVLMPEFKVTFIVVSDLEPELIQRVVQTGLQEVLEIERAERLSSVWSKGLNYERPAAAIRVLADCLRPPPGEIADYPGNSAPPYAGRQARAGSGPLDYSGPPPRKKPAPTASRSDATSMLAVHH